jgi:uncharacterized protein YjbI with pentapeptide repeats
MVLEHHDTDEFKHARFERADVSGATFHECDLRALKVTDSFVSDVNISRPIDNVVVNDVDVTAYVEAEFDRRHPERAQMR